MNKRMRFHVRLHSIVSNRYEARIRISVVLATTGVFAFSLLAFAQQGRVGYINPGTVSSPVRSLLFSMGDRLQRPGNERVTLNGRYADRSGASDIRIVWEIPGRFRLDRSDKPNQPLIFDLETGWNDSGITQLEAALLESLFDDAPASFFYEVSRGSSYRFLGNGFRANDLGPRNSKGPAFD